MKKIFLVIFLILAFAAACSFFIKYGQESFKEYSFLNNKNHEYVLAITESSAENKKENYLSNFYSDKTMYNVQCTMYNNRQELHNPLTMTYTANGQNVRNLIEKYNNLLKKNKKINPVTRAEIYYFLGNIYMKKDDYAGVLYCYKKALFFAPYIVETKYNIKNFVDFAEKINVPAKLLEYNNENGIKQLKLFVADKENLLNKQIDNTKTELKKIYSENIKLNDSIKILNDKNRDNLTKEIFSFEKEKENTEKQIKSLKEKTTKYEISEIQNIKKEILKFFPNVSKDFAAFTDFWAKFEKAVIQKISKNSSSAEAKNLQDKYFVSDLFLHKKNIWKNLIKYFKNTGESYGSAAEKNIKFINAKNINIFNDLNKKEKNLFKEIIETDKKANRFLNRRSQHLCEAKDNISYILKDTTSKKKEIYSELSITKNEQKKKNLKRELDKLALRQESADCSKDLAEIEIIRNNIGMYNEINLLEIKSCMFKEYINICQNLKVVSEYIKMFSDKQKYLLNVQQDTLNNIKTFDYLELKKSGISLKVCSENFNDMVTEQKCLFGRKKVLLANYNTLLTDIKQNIETAEEDENGEIFDKLKSFTDKELKFIDDKENDLSKVFEYDKVSSLQFDITAANLTAKEKIDNLEDTIEVKKSIENLFPGKVPEYEQKKVKSKNFQEKVIVSKMKNYEINTIAVQEEIKNFSMSAKEENKNKKKKKKK